MEQQNEQTPGAGHNISAFDECALRKDELVAAAAKFLDAGHKIDENNEGAVSDFIAQARAGLKQIDDRRVEEKAPHLAAGNAIQKKYADLSAPLMLAVDAIKKKMGAWLSAKQAKIDAERRHQQEVAEKARQEAEKLAAEAKPNDFQAQFDAEEAAKAAEAAEKAAEAAPVNAGAKGQFGKKVSMNTRYAGEIVDFPACLHHYCDEPDIRDVLLKLINRDVNAKIKIHNIPGVTVKPVHSAR